VKASLSEVHVKASLSAEPRRALPQEPRFLLPLLLPVCVLGASALQSRWVRGLWVAFNLLALAVYGGAHQVQRIVILGFGTS
jgi:hypothetical protein